ncbi:glycoside hydrolase family 9 protein [Streptomyces sp. NBC_00233]|uniref:glycoside hydrolase family 9 protein n=1 Tax=Streptomyces sp. NBC_00233 TaxID=2975686 RepID=UPI00224C8DF9|nr:glycoside hydrolase family 9 protein [Streptomyces sp. NBC_00233]MCX5231285.1 glycoside hydrolase family 9 protein [Streptomyces sp. NBC_00233]
MTDGSAPIRPADSLRGRPPPLPPVILRSVLRRAAAVFTGLALAAGTLTTTAFAADSAGADSGAALAAPADFPVRVNQLGYLPDGPKRATLVSSATAPLTWQLRDVSGAQVASGTTTVRGADQASGQSTHLVDFGGYTGTGSGFTLVVSGQVSHPFDISAALYDGLRADSMSFFYQQRSGIAIEAGLTGSAYARPAGHLGVAPNKGDTSVPCQAGVCDYRLDVRGGWYDAGDQGKYVVNGGIATWQVVNSFERARRSGGDAALGDSTLRVPERGNGVPDVLDEARWELEFLMRMQIPAGRPSAGMAFHKIHDNEWTGLPTRPELDDRQRELHRPSTAATLNLAATAAQCARVYAAYDSAFATRCLDAAGRAWTAAKANPNAFAPATDNAGGGAYEDADVSDEFYWAAAELLATTGEAQYRDAVTSSPHHVKPADAFWWGGTATLGRITLATVPGVALPADDLARVRGLLTAAADGHLSTMAAGGYAVPITATGYVWGSNSAVANNAMTLAVAYEITGAQRYRVGALESLDYLLGRNALDHSYVTGYGERASENQHHRFWAHQNDASLPHPPAGSFAGGPNAGLDDPVAKERLNGCAPAACYVDDIGSYSTNEVAINWNSSLAWLAAFAAERRGVPATPAVQVAPAAVTVPEGGFATVSVRLSVAPAQNVSVTVARTSGDQDLAVTAGSTLVFTPANWATAQHVSVSAAQDADMLAGSATFTAGGTGLSATTFAATEVEDDGAPPAASCSVTYRVESSWGNGFTATVAVKNTGTSTISGWTLGWTFAGDQKIGSAWNATVSQSGSAVTARDSGWNGTLTAGASASVGFQATYTGANAAPTRFALNDAICS